MTSHYLSKLFRPRSVAVVGASESPGSVAGQVLRNILAAGFEGDVYAVNSKYERVLGLPCYSSLSDLPKPVDLVAIATPASTVPDLLRSVGERGASAAIVYSAGFSEGSGGVALTGRLLDAAKATKLRVLGPNCLGLIRPSAKLNATFSAGQARPGVVGAGVAIRRVVHGDPGLGRAAGHWVFECRFRRVSGAHRHG